MRISGQEGNTVEIEPGVGNTSGNESGFTTASESQTLAIERSNSEEPGASEGNESLPVRRTAGPRTPEGKQRSKCNALRHGIFSRSILLKGESRAEYDSLLDGFIEAFAPGGKCEEVLVENLVTNVWRKRRLIHAEAAEIRKDVDFMQFEQQTREQKEVHEIDRSLALNCSGGLISRIDNPHILNRCLDTLDFLRALFAKEGFTKIEPAVLKSIYGNDFVSNQGINLFKLYNFWLNVSQISEDKRKAHGLESPEQCKSKVLKAINMEIRRLRKHQKERAAIESERAKVEASRHAVPESPALDRLLRYEVNLDRSFDRTLSQLERLQRMRRGQPVPPRIDVNLSSS